MNVHQIGSCFGVHVQAINFFLVPPPYTRVASVGVASFTWVNVLYLIKRREVRSSNYISSYLFLFFLTYPFRNRKLRLGLGLTAMSMASVFNC
ncbi:hypothetical protein TNCT_583381 [Trichonephila clavata]|uniref:Uncharacterized protein n=1 Tax=Trichonephila clavata TaxID=2740835 RepID=A0A8X6FM31_TRICU|nr:hypothetical protein TNCT_583381 [Trichonephila clavata]